ncbi:MAG: DUF362 domain-containing protein [Candidatus Limnocylindrales bacterium]
MTVPPVVRSLHRAKLDLPRVHVVRQLFNVPPPVDVAARVADEWQRLVPGTKPSPGARIAVAVGSRGVDGLLPAVRALVSELLSAGCEPFIVPAMGSHGGATAAGQTEVLAGLGITSDAVGAPIRATMDVVPVGAVGDIPLCLDRFAAGADGIVVVNRVKPHTDFGGPIGSGLLKMLCIGLGNQEGADRLHRLGVVRDLGEIVREAGVAILERAPVLCGVAILENQQHRACDVRIVPGREIESAELALQEVAKGLLPGLPLDDIDLLIVDEMGKDISGAGLDPNVIGRSLGPWQVKRDRPRITRIFVRDLSPASEGNACGLGFIDVTTPQLIEKVDLEVTAVNAITACFPEDVRLPLTLPNDRDAIAAMLDTLRPFTAEDLRLVHIRSTLALERLVVSEGCLPALWSRADIVVEGGPRSLEFDEDARLVSPLSD